jgi:serine phosphatase RsbU (regulator of sigma subunit)/anti-sigma regulatory factor (Ser/Thr protein kinase)
MTLSTEMFPSRQSGERLTVLVVDDTPANVRLLSSLLREQYRIKVTNSGARALKLAAEAPPDLVLLDIMMPEMDGYETLSRFKSNETLNHIPVVMISALDEIDSIVRCIEMGAEDYISKPFDPVLLRARIGASLERKRLRDSETLYRHQIEEYNLRLEERVRAQIDIIREQNESRQRELETLVLARTAELAEKNEQLRAAGERVQDEIQLARNMQLAILPQHFPDDPDCSVHASMFPARELGGDFYDCFLLSDGRYGVLVADVSGKGVGAAFFMAVSRTVLLDIAMTGAAPADVFVRGNDLLCERNPMELFVTACYAIYNPHDGKLIYASAGHHPPLLRRATGQVESLPCPRDIALGVMSDMTYSNHCAEMERGDTLLLYTDGVTEAFSADGEAYGDMRLHDWFAAAMREENAAARVASLVASVASFVDGAEASDDLTCLVLCRKKGADILNAVAGNGDNILLLDYRMPSRVDEIARLADVIDGLLPDRPDITFSINLCLDELLTNTILYGLGGASDQIIDVRITRSDDWLEITLKDCAPPFNPFAEAPEPDLDLNVDERPIGGLGVFLVKTMMDEVHACCDGDGNRIVMLKAIK